MNIEEMFYISEKDWYKLQAWAQLAHDEDKNEISGLMTAIPQKDGRYLMSDVEILKQENTAVETDIDGDSVMEYKMKYGMKYQNPEMKFVWWHSHHNMAVNWSTTDLKEIDAWKNSSFSLALVVNLREEYTFRVSLWSLNGIPIEKHIDTSITIERKDNPIKITKSMKKEYEEKCSNQVKNNIVNYQTWGHNVYAQNHRQMNLLASDNKYKGMKNIDIEKYSDAFTKVESLQDSLVDGTLSHRDYLKEFNKFNKTCKKNKLPFKLKNFGKDYNNLMNVMMTKTPDELFEWEDNEIKDKYEIQHQWGGVNGWH